MLGDMRRYWRLVSSSVSGGGGVDGGVKGE